MTDGKPGRHHGLRLPFRLQVVYGSRKFYTVFSCALAAFSLYGPIPARAADHNGYRYLIGPLVCPVIALVLHVLFPFNPYRWLGYSARRLNRLDERDEDARHLVQLIATPEYRTTALVAAPWLAGILWVTMGVVTFVFRSSLNWHPTSPWLFAGALGGLIGSWMFVRVHVVSWAPSTWWARYGEGSGS